MAVRTLAVLDLISIYHRSLIDDHRLFTTGNADNTLIITTFDQEKSTFKWSVRIPSLDVNVIIDPSFQLRASFAEH